MIYTSYPDRYSEAIEFPWYPSHIVDRNGMTHTPYSFYVDTETGECRVYLHNSDGCVYEDPKKDGYLAVDTIYLPAPLTLVQGLPPSGGYFSSGSVVQSK